MSALGFIVVAPNNFRRAFVAPSMAIAAARAGAIGLVDLEGVELTQDALHALRKLNEHSMNGTVGVRCDVGSISIDDIAEIFSEKNQPVILFTTCDPTFDAGVLQRDVNAARHAGFRVMVEAVSIKEALLAESCGADAIVAKGHESGGRVSDTTTFVLVQQCARQIKIPVWAHGGIGLHTAGAVAAAGVAGVVLDSQLYLCRDSNVPPEVRMKLERLDGSESSLIETAGGQSRRILNLNGEQLNIGQDSCFARSLALAGGTIAGAIDAIRDSVEEQIKTAAESSALREGAELAQSHGTRYPIVQGAMTRVSDTSDFALSVAAGGGLPFLALSLMRGADIEKLLEETRTRLKDLPWGVGILGFVPQQLRQEQMEVVNRHKPPFALIAGGRPDQAKALDDAGTKTYLHVPSPLLLKSFIEMGSRRFIFEGKECGGHVGPRSSFVLWESMIEVLLESIGPRDNPSSFHVLFAGGIHDDLSAAMVATMAAPLTARGIKIGMLLGTAYLFTEEAVTSGAIVEKFQQAALKCDETVLLETGPGHSIRCIDSPYKKTFDRCRERLQEESKSRDEIREELELMNLGRLRIASKGLNRGSNNELENLPVEKQWQDGMYMIGQVASMHDKVLSIADLHENVSTGGHQRLVAMREASLIEQVSHDKQQEGIAIVGMSCMFPEGNDVETYWQNILNKVDTITEIPESHFDWKNYFDANPLARDRIVSKWGGFLKDVVFEPAQYGIPPSSLESIDPMQVLILEAARAALNDAGYNQRKFPRQKTSVILANAGHGPITALYSLRSMLGWKLADLDEETVEQIKKELPEWTEDSFAGYLGNVTAGRVANRLDLKGINFSIDAACASSLAALYVAIGDLRSGASDVVLLGATDTHNQPGDYLSFSKTHALSPKGKCQTFDADADGIVISEGVAMLVLKRLSDAERDGDRIYSVIKGIGGSSDGRDLSLTAPRPAGQALALERAYADAGISPDTVGLVEAHGTGTVAGDKAEVEALTGVFQRAGAKKESCAIGSVKTNIGHTKAAAGLASVIKIAKSLHHKVLPPSINVKKPNPACKFGEGPFYLSTECRPWFHTKEVGTTPRRAGVSAFGFGGTNFHTVLEEYVPPCNVEEAPVVEAWPAELFVWRAASQDDLAKSIKMTEAAAAKMQAENKVQSEVTSEDRRRLFELAMKQNQKFNDLPAPQCALAIVATSCDDLIGKIQRVKNELSSGTSSGITDLPNGIHYWISTDKVANSKVAFLFPGQGSQRTNMLKELSLFFPQIRQTIEVSDLSLSGKFEERLSKYIYPVPALTDEVRQRQQEELTDTRIAQPALGACDLAMLRLVSSFGITPDMVAGHSFGEYVALHAAGVLSDQQLLELSAERGRILAECAVKNPGAMAAISTDAESVKRLIAKIEGVYLANENAPNQCIVSGDEQSIASALSSFKDSNIACKKIPVSAAFHSPLMNESKEPLQKALLRCEYAPPTVPVYSNTTIKPYEGNSKAIVEQLAEHALKPVQFAKQLERMHDDGGRIFIEVGPGSVLTGLTEATLRGKDFVALNMERTVAPLQHLLGILGFLAARGLVHDIGPLFWNRMPSISQNAAAENPGKLKLQYRVNSVKIERVDTNKVEKNVPPDPKIVKTSSNWQALQNKPGDAAKSKVISTENKTVMSETRNQMATPSKNTNGSNVNGSSVNGSNMTGSNMNASSMNRNDDGVERVMLEFQKSMLEMTNRFLESQENVMLAYLQAKSGGTPMPSDFVSRTHSTQNVQYQPAPVVVQPDLFAHTQTNGHDTNGHDLNEYGTNGYDSNGFETSGRGIPESNGEVPQPAESKASEGLDAEFLIDNLYEIVSERTGYPRSMLDPNLDLEADLGIDSIKRVEILNNFRKLLPLATQEKVESGIEKLAVTKTLQGIIEWIQGLDDCTTDDAGSATELETGRIENVARGTVGVKVLEPPTPSKIELAPVTLIVADSIEESKAIKTQLDNRQQSVVVLTTSELELDTDSIAKRIESVRKESGNVGSLIYICGSSPSVKRLFLLSKELENDLRGAAARGNRSAVICATSLGGSFGIENDNEELSLEQLTENAGVVGFAKTIAKEWMEVHAKVVDFDANVSAETKASALVTELYADDSIVEIGNHKGTRIGVDIVQSPYSSDESVEPPSLNSSSVILVTGGARGITAEITLDLARRYKPNFILVGRLPRPSETESAVTAGLESAKEIKAAIIEDMRNSGRIIQVRDVERAYQQLLREREVRSTLNTLKAAGSTVRYCSVDVTDRKAFSDLIDSIYETSNIDGIINGAGIIEDAFIKDKSPESFDRVFRTKIVSAITLAEKVRFETIKFMYLYSSVVGRTGNAGQCDYVAANEGLSKLANRLNTKYAARIASIMWGPWQAGMAPPELEEVFASHGWSMIQPADGRACFHQELFNQFPNQSEVLLVGKLKGERKPVDATISGASVPASPSAIFELAEVKPTGAIVHASRLTSSTPPKFALTIDTNHHRYLHDHKFDGIPVMPMAVALETMLEAASSIYPDGKLVRVSNMDIPAGIVFHQERKDFIVESKPSINGSVDLQLWSVGTPNKAHFRCSAQFAHEPIMISDDWITKRGSNIPRKLGRFRSSTESVLPTPRDVYGKWLFHGPIFQGIRAVSCLAPDAIAGQVVGAAPDRCLTAAGSTHWILDPVLLDSAMQLAGIWARHFSDITVLPTGFKAIQFFGFTSNRGESYTAQVYLDPDMAADLSCDLAMYDELGDLYFVIEGLSGIASKAFNRFAAQQPVQELV